MGKFEPFQYKCGLEIYPDVAQLVPTVSDTREPVFTKSRPHGYDNRPMTWATFLVLRDWAQQTANELGYPVYLVGSSLSKTVPRDIDVSVIMPLEDYIKTYGPLPEAQEEYPEYLQASWTKTIKHYFSGEEAIGDYHFDFKVCADSWFVDKPKLLLAEPKKEGKE